MPFQSAAQRRYLYKYHPAIAERWEKETPKGKKLPEHKKQKPKKKSQHLRLSLKLWLKLPWTNIVLNITRDLAGKN